MNPAVAALIAAAADSTRNVPEVARQLGATAPPAGNPYSLQGSAQILEGWHDFYALAGSAAATLVGLVFVALSFNLDILVHDRHAHLLAYARQTLMEYLFVITISLIFSVPHLTVRPLGLVLAAFAITWLALAFLGRRRASRRARKEHDENVPTQRRWAGMAAIGLAAVAGLDMVIQRNPYAAYLMITAVCALLANAAGGSWHLLVEVGKLKSGSKNIED